MRLNIKITFFRVTYTCDPLHWLTTMTRVSYSDVIFNRWTLLSRTQTEILCLNSGTWNVDLNSIACLSTEEANQFEVRNDVEAEAIRFEVSVELCGYLYPLKERKKAGFSSFFPRFAGSGVLIQCMSTTTHSLLNRFYVFASRSSRGKLVPSNIFQNLEHYSTSSDLPLSFLSLVWFHFRFIFCTIYFLIYIFIYLIHFFSQNMTHFTSKV